VPVIEEDTTGRGYNIVFGKKEKPVFVDSTAKPDYVVAALKGTRAKKDEKKQVLIPKSDAIVEEILNNLESDKAQIKSPSVAELEGKINGLVYTLYGLNEKDVEVIDDFLRGFSSVQTKYRTLVSVFAVFIFFHTLTFSYIQP